MSPDPEELDYLSFIGFAVDRMARRLPGTDRTAMRLGLTLHRILTTLVHDWESTVHRPRGWSWSGFRVLVVLWLAGPLESRHVAKLSGMSRAAVSSVVNTLERDGLVSRTPAEHDRRAVILGLTGTGLDAVAEACIAHNARERAWAEALTESEQTVLIGLLGKLVSGPAQARQPGA